MNYGPVALLIHLDGSETLVSVSNPPPPTYLVPRRVAFTVRIDDVPSMSYPPHRLFELSRYRTSSHRWWRVYNEGRSATQENGYVYFETDTDGAALPDAGGRVAQTENHDDRASRVAPSVPCVDELDLPQRSKRVQSPLPKETK